MSRKAQDNSRLAHASLLGSDGDDDQGEPVRLASGETPSE